MPAKYRDRAPRMDHLDQGDAWIFEGWDGPINFGFNASAGRPPEKRTPWIRWEDVPRHSYDPVARAAALDQGGVDAELLYATPRIAAGMMASARDRDFHLATVQVAVLLPLCRWNPEIAKSGAPCRHNGSHCVAAVEPCPLAWASFGDSRIGRHLFQSLGYLAGRRAN